MRLKSIEGVRTGNLFTIPLDLLREEPGFNERNYEAPEVVAQIRKFADAYAAGEFVPPLVIRNSGETIYIVEGHLRRRGALLARSEGAEIASLPATQFTGDDSDRIAFMVSASQGLPLSAVGRARAYLRLSRLGLSNEEIATKVGHTSTHVAQYLTFASANRDVQAAVERNDVSFTTAVDLVRKHGDEAGKVIAEKLTQAVATAKPSRRKAVKKAKVTGRVLGKGKAPLVTAAATLLAKHGSAVAANGGSLTVMVAAADLQALFDALPKSVRSKAKETQAATC